MRLIDLFSSRTERGAEAAATRALLQATRAAAEPQSTEPPASVPESARITARLVEVLGSINTRRMGGPRLTVARLAQILGFRSVQGLEDILSGRQDATFDFLAHFAEALSINSDWLVEGRGAPFGGRIVRPPIMGLYPLEYLDEISNCGAEAIYFVWCDSDCGEAAIVLRHSELRYTIVPKYWHISSQVGGTGQEQLLSFYALLKRLDEMQPPLSRYGRILSNSKFNDLYSGRMFPGSILEDTSQSYWWDDFTDIYHRFPIADRYEQYGDNFRDAQNIVRQQIEYRKKRGMDPLPSPPAPRFRAAPAPPDAPSSAAPPVQGDARLTTRVFISYGGPDASFARKLKEGLAAAGVQAFLFEDDAPPGERLHRLMRKGVNEHHRVILVCSKSSLSRPGVRNELEETLAREAREGGATCLIPVRLDDSVFDEAALPDPEVAMALRDRVIQDFSRHDDPNAFATQLAKLVHVILHAPRRN